MKKNILIISECFYPANIVGAVRPTKICKYLTKRGYNVDVITKNPTEDEVGKKYYRNLYAWGEKTQITDEQKGHQGNVSSKKHNALYKKIYKYYYAVKGIRTAKSTVKKFDKIINSIDISKYDAVFSTYGPLTSLLCGMHLKKKNPNVKWICDFRDPVVVDVVPKLFHPYYRHLQNKACKKADCVTTVSNGYFERICAKKFADKSYMIPNGYDLDDIEVSGESTPNKKLTLVYVGALYDGKRDLSPLFCALRELSREGKIELDKISVEYAGRDFATLKSQADKYDLANITVNHGQMKRRECLDFQASSDMLLLATWNDKNEFGVFPGKLLEYMLMNKPIISFTCGEIADSEVSETITNASLGFAYEEARKEKDFALLKDYLTSVYNQFNEKKNIDFIPNKELVARYNWENLKGEIEQLL